MCLFKEGYSWHSICVYRIQSHDCRHTPPFPPQHPQTHSQRESENEPQWYSVPETPAHHFLHLSQCVWSFLHVRPISIIHSYGSVVNASPVSSLSLPSSSPSGHPCLLPAPPTYRVSPINWLQMWGVSNGDGALVVLRISDSVCNRNLSDAIITPTGFFQAKSVPIVTGMAVLFVSSHRSRLPRHLQLVKCSRSTHASGVARRRWLSLRSLVEEEKTKKMMEALCSTPAKASDSWTIVYYYKWLCGTLRKPLEHYSSSQTSDRAGFCLLIHPDALLVCCVQSESKMSSTVWSLW